MPKTALEDVRVIDLGRYQAGPRIGLVLARLGAEQLVSEIPTVRARHAGRRALILLVIIGSFMGFPTGEVRRNTGATKLGGLIGNVPRAREAQAQLQFVPQLAIPQLQSLASFVTALTHKKRHRRENQKSKTRRH